jgi:aminopeptidase N
MIYGWIQLLLLAVYVTMQISNAFRAQKGLTRSVHMLQRHASVALPTLGNRISQQPFKMMKTGTRALSFALAALSTSASAPVTVTTKPVEYFRKDYKPLPFKAPEIYMDLKLGLSDTTVTTKTTIERVASAGEDLVFNGEETLELLGVRVGGAELTKDMYTVLPDGSLKIFAAHLPSSSKFEIETTVRLNPEKNLALSGLYASSGMLCTQCEAMGFRRITYSFDRPDNLSRYKVRLEGDTKAFPILLSNGNRIDGGSLPGGKHFAVWEDPFLKPSYLFAVVAGNLGFIEDTYKTTSGKTVKLGIFSDKENVAKLDHAMYSLKESMRWDENTFGLECDLDVYNIVATNDFNMGAMENKGLNVFNSAYVLADPKTATDVDYERILAVIAHEYFHNWTGNRVTVRDWFQLTLKEGLTVFRDQWFSSDATSKAVKR